MSQQTKPSILLIRTGGTLDSEMYADPRNPPEFVDTLSAEDSLITDVLKGLGKETMVDHFTWLGNAEQRFVKDSQKFTQDDIEELADLIREDNHHCFILTHGTDNMAKNAEALKDLLAGSDKVVVFVGAMVPLSMDGASFREEKIQTDAKSFLSYAIEHISEMDDGVYITARDSHTKMTGFFDPAEVSKDKKASKQDLVFTVTPKNSMNVGRC